MKLALATWNGRISPVFDVAREVELCDVERGKVVARRKESLPGTDPAAQAGRLAELGTEALICGAISQPMAYLLAGKGIHVAPFVAGEVEQVLSAWVAGQLPSPAFSMPGCCGRMRRCRGGRGGGNGFGWGGRGRGRTEPSVGVRVSGKRDC